MALNQNEILEYKRDFKASSSDDLLQKLRSDSLDLTPEAVEALRQILNEREITDAAFTSIQKNCPDCNSKHNIDVTTCDCGFQFIGLCPPKPQQRSTGVRTASHSTSVTSFPILTFLSSVYRIVGFLMLLPSLYYFIYEGMIEPNMQNHRFGSGDLSELLGGLLGCLIALGVIASGEMIRVMLSIEHNTRKND
jgi:hypothetical protein